MRSASDHKTERVRWDEVIYRGLLNLPLYFLPPFMFRQLYGLRGE